MSDKVCCGTHLCDFEAVEVHPLSRAVDEIGSQPFCCICGEAYSQGARHGRMRAIRDLARAGLIEAAGLLNGRPLTAGQVARITLIDTSGDYGDEDV